MGSITRALQCHADTAPSFVTAVGVEIERPSADRIRLRYQVAIETGSLVLPEQTKPGRADGLWKTTCFEIFLGSPVDAAYTEFDFSPSSQWAAYHFESYRAGRLDVALVDQPEIMCNESESGCAIDVGLTLAEPASTHLLIGISAVIEEIDGAKSYWALCHPPGLPDFHHPHCFALTLPAPDAP